MQHYPPGFDYSRELGEYRARSQGGYKNPEKEPKTYAEWALMELHRPVNLVEFRRVWQRIVTDMRFACLGNDEALKIIDYVAKRMSILHKINKQPKIHNPKL